MATKSLSILLGQCLPSLKQTASKIRVRRMKLDTNIHKVRTSHFCAISRN